MTMTDPQNTAPAPPPAPPTTTASSGPAMPGMLASLSQPELFVAAGAALLVLTALLFTVIAGYGISDLVLVAATFALVAVLRHRQLPLVIASNYKAMLFAVGALLVVVALRNVLNDVVYIATPPAGITVSSVDRDARLLYRCRTGGVRRLADVEGPRGVTRLGSGAGNPPLAASRAGVGPHVDIRGCDAEARQRGADLAAVIGAVVDDLCETDANR